MKIAVFSTKSYDQEYFENYNNEYQFEFSFFETPLNSKTVDLTKGFDAVCVFVNDKVNPETIEKLAQNGIGLIAMRCAGYNNVDVPTAQKHNIKLVRVPAYSPEAVAEHALALILTLNRKTHKAYNRVREGNFSLKNLIGFNLHGKTVGVIGTGKIGAAFCKIVQGFGCKVIAYDLYPSEQLKEIGVEYTTVDSVFKQSDIVSFHCPLNEATTHLLNDEALAGMKDGVMIINTSRGGLIDTEATIKYLKNKKIGFLGIDVYEQEANLFFEDLSESIIQDDFILRLNSFPNVLITSHQAYFTKEAMEQITLTTLENLKAFQNQDTLVNEIV